MAPTRPESQARRHIAASPRTKASELRGASRPRAATTVSKYNMTDSVPTVGSNYQPSGSTSAGHLKPFRGAKVVAPRKSVHITDSEFGAFVPTPTAVCTHHSPAFHVGAQSPGGSTHSLGDLECQAPHADPTHAARLLSSSDEDEEDIPHEASTAVASRSERPPVGYTSRPTTGQTFDTDTPMLLTSLRDARHGDSADSTPQLTALAGEPAGSDAPCDATRVSSTFSQAASTARDMSRSDLLTPERWEKLIELVELCQRQVSVEEQAKVQAQLEVKRLQHTVHELSTKLQRFEVQGAAANAGSSTAQGPQSRDFNGEESAGVLAQVNTAKGCNLGSEVLEPLSASEQATFDAALRSQAKQDAHAPRTASRDAAAVTKELDEQGGESSDDDDTASSQDNSQ